MSDTETPATFEEWAEAVLTMADVEGMADDTAIPTWPDDVVRQAPDKFPQLTVGALRQAARPRGTDPVAKVRHDPVPGAPGMRQMRLEWLQYAPPGAALYAEPQPRQLPDGYAIVPLKPTKAMRDACKVAGKTRVWDDMIAARPEPPEDDRGTA